MIFFDVDTQRDFMDSDGALYVPGSDLIRPNLERLLRAAGERRRTTVSSRCAHQPGDPEFEIFPPHCLEGTPGAERIFPDLPQLPRRVVEVDAKPEPQAEIVPATHYIIKKKAFDIFSNEWIDGLRRNRRFEGVECVVFGVATDYCVRACGLGLAQAGAHVLLVEDAIRGVAAETTDRTLEEMRVATVQLTTTDQVLGRI
jgi:nicotinamidase/pyrazinamidase